MNKESVMAVGTLSLDNQEFVVLPKADYLRLLGLAGDAIPAGSVEASRYLRESIGGDLRRAREAAGLTQAELARRLRKSQSMVSGAENGTVKTGWPYARAVLKACGLPEDWQAPG
jgi:DNA-binding XRE family transcriptional regulator